MDSVESHFFRIYSLLYGVYIIVVEMVNAKRYGKKSLAQFWNLIEMSFSVATCC